MQENKLTGKQKLEIEEGLYDRVMTYFTDGTYSSTREFKVSFFDYAALPYTARPYSGYSNLRANPMMNRNSADLNECKKDVRRFLKKHGFTRVRFDVSYKTIHYGYISGPDDFPMAYLNAIYFG